MKYPGVLNSGNASKMNPNSYAQGQLNAADSNPFGLNKPKNMRKSELRISLLPNRNPFAIQHFKDP